MHRSWCGILMLLVGCVPSLDGFWEGDLDCADGEAKPEVEFDLRERARGVWDGDGEIRYPLGGGEELVSTFEIEASLLGRAGAGLWAMAVDLDDCAMEGETAGCQEVSGFYDDARGRIAADVSDGSRTCELTAYR